MKDPRMIKGLNERIRISIRVKEVPNNRIAEVFLQTINKNER